MNRGRMIKVLLTTFLLLLVSHGAHGSFPLLTPKPPAIFNFIGISMKNHSSAIGQLECRDPHSKRCQHFIDTLCESTQAVLWHHEDFRIDTHSCLVRYGYTNDTRVELTTFSDRPDTFDRFLLKNIIGSRYIEWSPDNTYFGYVKEVYATNMRDSGPSPFDYTRRRLEFYVTALLNEKITPLKPTCNSWESRECVEFVNYLCNATGEALSHHMEFDRLFSGCILWPDFQNSNRFQLIVYLYRNGRYSWTDFEKLRILLPAATYSAKPTVPSIAWIEGVNGVGIENNGWPLADSRREKIWISGTVRMNGNTVSYTERCRDGHNEPRCLLFRNSLCRTVQNAFRTTYHLGLAWGACDVQRQSQADVKVTVYPQPLTRQVNRKELTDALLSKTYGDGWAYFTSVREITAYKTVIV